MIHGQRPSPCFTMAKEGGISGKRPTELRNDGRAINTKPSVLVPFLPWHGFLLKSHD